MKKTLNGERDEGPDKAANFATVLVTVCNIGKTLGDRPQGLEGVVVKMEPPVHDKLFYFGVNPTTHLTDLSPNDRTCTSDDGGVLFCDVPINPNQELRITAEKDGLVFSSTTVVVTTANFLVNGAPNQGPRVQDGQA